MVQCCPILSPHTGRDLVDSVHAKTLFMGRNSLLVYFGSIFFPVRFKWALKIQEMFLQNQKRRHVNTDTSLSSI